MVVFRKAKWWRIFVCLVFSMCRSLAREAGFCCGVLAVLGAGGSCCVVLASSVTVLVAGGSWILLLGGWEGIVGEVGLC